MTLLRFLLIVFFFLPYISSADDTQKEKRKGLLHTPQALEQIAKEEGVREEFVEVSAESYPGLQLTVASPLEEVTQRRTLKYRPLFPHPDMELLHEQRMQDLYGLIGPLKSGELIDVALPTD
jgi:hypothetical protein